MIDPVNLQRIENLVPATVDNEARAVINLPIIPEYDEEDYDIYDDKDFKKYISDVEKEVRTSFEYREMIKYMRTYMGMGESASYENINNSESFNVKIEIHHHPFTLYDICTIVINKRLFYKESMDLQMTAKEVMQLHYKLMVGLIPLSQTEHELVHKLYLFIPVDRVIGRYNLFVDYYKPFMTPEQLDVLERIEEYSMIYDNMVNEELLEQKEIYINSPVSYKLPKTEDIINSMSNRITAIKNNGYTLPILNENKHKNEKVEAISFDENWKFEAISFN